MAKADFVSRLTVYRFGRVGRILDQRGEDPTAVQVVVRASRVAVDVDHLSVFVDAGGFF